MNVDIHSILRIWTKRLQLNLKTMTSLKKTEKDQISIFRNNSNPLYPRSSRQKKSLAHFKLKLAGPNRPGQRILFFRPCSRIWNFQTGTSSPRYQKFLIVLVRVGDLSLKIFCPGPTSGLRFKSVGPWPQTRL